MNALPKYNKSIFLFAAGFICCTGLSFSTLGGLTGKWSGRALTPGGDEIAITYTFKAENNSLTGYGSSPQGDIAITNGKIDGAAFSFMVPYNGVDIINKGTFYAEGDSVALAIEYYGAQLHAKLTRVQPAH
nr:hypothetical protein [uncultured Mucilaginibacter sp.]